jgi:uncharacterized protein (TIGR03000 family)
MSRYAFLGAVVLSCALTLATTESAQAQRFGFGVGVGFGPRVGFGWGVGRYYYPGYYSGYGYPGYYGYSYPGYYYAPSYAAAPPYVVASAPVYTRPSFYYADPAANLSTPRVLDSGRLQIFLPDANAQVWIEGQRTQTTGANRVYQSPTLTRGKPYTYTVKATWMQDGKEVTDERTVPISADSTAVIDFTKPATK